MARELPAGEAARKAVHVSMAAFALLMRWFTVPQAAVCAVAAFAVNWAVLPRLIGHRLSTARAGSGDGGVLLYPVVVLALIVLFQLPPGDGGLVFAALGWGLLAGGDAAAGVVGLKWARTGLPWNSAKSWEGLVAYIVAGGGLAALLAGWVARVPLATIFADSGWVLRWHVLAVLAAAVVAALMESVPHGLDDNVLPPLAGTLVAFCLYGMHGRGMEALWTTADSRAAVVAVLVNGFIALVAYRIRLLEPKGIVAAFVLGVVTLAFGTWRAYLLLGVFLAVGTLATRFRREAKRAAGLVDEASGRRGVSEVVANGSVCGVGCVLWWLTGWTSVPAALVIAGSMAAALADTTASEVGKAVGRRTYRLPSLALVPKGTEGAVSLAGTIAGVVGSLLVAGLAAGVGLVPISAFLPVLIGGLVAMVVESLLSQLGPSTNAGKNLANTVIGALVAFAVWRLLIVL